MIRPVAISNELGEADRVAGAFEILDYARTVPRPREGKSGGQSLRISN